MMNVACPEMDEADTLDSVATILARGVIRLRQRDIDEARNPQDSATHGLALDSGSCPSVVDGSESRRKVAE